jgi:site-specific DNA-methyltransferase (adenine-specific)
MSQSAGIVSPMSTHTTATCGAGAAEHADGSVAAGPAPASRLRSVARRTPHDPASSGAGRPRRATTTSNFGVSRRESHDSSDFYARFSPPVIDLDSHPAGAEVDRAIDALVAGDARDMSEVATGSVALVVTSPPYFAGKEYEEALGEGHVPGSYLDFLDMLTEVFAECVRCLEPGGRIAVNVANLGRRPYRSLSGDVTAILQDRLGLLLRGEVIWQKQRAAGGNCAWGSFQRPANPVLRDTTERVVVASKGRFDRAWSPSRRAEAGLPHVATITRDEFIDATLDVWELPAESATRVGHPAPFPVALPERLIQLHTYAGDLVLDPFMGSGSTALAAVRTGRHFVGYDTDEGYVALARQRISELQPALGDAAHRPDGGAAFAPVLEALEEGRSARDVAEVLLQTAGMEGLRRDVRLPGGVQVSFAAPRDDGTRVLFEVCGSFSTSRGGLNRGDVLWRALGKVAVVSVVAPDDALVLLSGELPVRGSAGARPLETLLEAGQVTDVIDLRDPDALERVRALR